MQLMKIFPSFQCAIGDEATNLGHWAQLCCFSGVTPWRAPIGAKWTGERYASKLAPKIVAIRKPGPKKKASGRGIDVIDPDTEFGHFKSGNVHAGIQLWADKLEEPITELTSKIVHTKFNSLAVSKFEADAQAYCFLHADAAREDSQGIVYTSGPPGLSMLFFSLFSKPGGKYDETHGEVKPLLVQQKRLSKLNLKLHYWRDFSHITALLGRDVAKALANNLSAQYKATVTTRYIPVPLSVTLAPVWEPGDSLPPRP